MIELTSLGKYEDRGDFPRWELAESDIEGCVSLVTPTRVRPRVESVSHAAPVLLLIDEFDAKGFARVDERVVHSPTSAKRYDGRQIWKRRAYLQCLLRRQQLFKAGAKAFPSGLPQAFYELLMEHLAKTDATLALSNARR